MNDIKVIAFYLPQYHPIPENDEWWGKGFTEWTNVAKAKPLYKGHYQPHIPADLGFYDLRMPEIREQQAEMAKEAGIYGFCYWHYWFGDGKMLLEKPFKEVLESGKPNFPFCLGWANGSWSNETWEKSSLLQESKILIEQKYSLEDYKKHIEFLIPIFKDERYIKIENKPLFYIHDPLIIPNIDKLITIWQETAKQNGLEGIFFVGRSNNLSFWEIDKKGNKKYNPFPSINNAKKLYQQVLDMGFDAVNSRGMDRAEIIVGGKMKTLIGKIFSKVLKKGIFLRKYDHKKIIENYYVPEDHNENIFPTLLPNWDRSPRQGKKAAICYNSTPEIFEKNIKLALEIIKEKSPSRKILFLQAWNEWAEGNHVEPDLKYGHGFLNVLKKYLK